MSTKATVLVLEDSQHERDQLTRLLSGLGLDVWPTESPERARSWVQRHNLAVIDWNMAHTSDRGGDGTSGRVLETLAREARQTLTIVYARDLMRADVNRDVTRAHPAALLHDKDSDLDLERRLIDILSPHVGDLAIDERIRTHICHVPSGRRYKHRAAFKLMTNHPNPVFFPFENHSMYVGMARFRAWLVERESTVRVVSLGRHTASYRLEIVGDDAAHH